MLPFSISTSKVVWFSYHFDFTLFIPSPIGISNSISLSSESFAFIVAIFPLVAIYSILTRCFHSVWKFSASIQPAFPVSMDSTIILSFGSTLASIGKSRIFRFFILSIIFLKLYCQKYSISIHQ